MSELEHYRKEIDEIDTQLTKLFEQRMNAVSKISDYKKINKLPIYNQQRENQVIEKNMKHLNNKNYHEELRSFFISTMNIAKHLEYKAMYETAKQEVSVRKDIAENLDSLKIGYYGVQGAFCEAAMLKYFGEVKDAKNYEEFEDVFEAIKNDEIDYGVVPIENSSTGTIIQVLDLLNKCGYYIVGEETVAIQQHLIGHKGTNLELVEEVYSHPQGFQQTTEFLNKYKQWKFIPFHSTADSVKLVSELNDKTKVAIASSRAAKIYNLDIIKENINNKSENTTRFIIVSKQLKVDESNDKVSVVFSLEHKAGTLFHLLRHFAENNINMMKIESRPQEKGNWKYLIYIDFEGNIENEQVKKALRLIQQGCEYFRLLGCYKQFS